MILYLCHISFSSTNYSKQNKERKKKKEQVLSFFHNFTVCSGRIWIPEPHQQQSSWEKLSFNTFYLSVARNGLEVFQIEYVIWFPKDIQFFIYTFYSKNQRYTCIFIHLLLFALFPPSHHLAYIYISVVWINIKFVISYMHFLLKFKKINYILCLLLVYFFL